MSEENTKNTRRDHIKTGLIGMGGGGGNSLMYVYERLHQFSFLNMEYFVLNTDQQALDFISKVEVNVTKILIGSKSLKGLGTGAKPLVGYRAMKNSIRNGELDAVFKDKSILFLSAGLGGGSGSGGIVAIVEEARKRKIITLVFGTYPWKFEGPKREENALLSLRSMYKIADSVIIVNNELLLENTNEAGSVGKEDMFWKANEFLKHIVLTIPNMIMQHSFINLDYNDFKNAVAQSQFGFFYVQEMYPKETLYEAFLRSFPKSLDIANAHDIIVNFSGRKGIVTLAKINEFFGKLNKLNPKINVLFGMSYNKNIYTVGNGYCSTVSIFLLLCSS